MTYSHEKMQTVLISWLPSLIVAVVAWLAFVLVGNTPVIRAGGLALVIAGMTLALQRWGRWIAVCGGLALAFSPAFWSQTGGNGVLQPTSIILGLVVAGVGALALAWWSQRPSYGVGVGAAIFSLLFVTVIGDPRSLRLTTLLAAWLIVVLVDALMVSNPRPDEATPIQLRRRHTYGILLLLTLGIFNDSLFTLFMPAVILGLFLANTRLPTWYWAALMLLLVVGGADLYRVYVDSGWWGASAADVIAQGARMPAIVAGAWRVPSRWIDLFVLIVEQYTVVGLVFGVMGLARLARWYPPLGIVTMTAYATYFLFGLVYFGRDAAVLLLPLLMIQILWMGYAVYTLGQWLERGVLRQGRVLVTGAFCLLPLFLFLKVAGFF